MYSSRTDGSTGWGTRIGWPCSNWQVPVRAQVGADSWLTTRIDYRDSTRGQLHIAVVVRWHGTLELPHNLNRALALRRLTPDGSEEEIRGR